MHKDLECNVAYFSMDENNPRIKTHCAEGGYAAVYENGYVSIMKGTWKIRVLPVKNIPLTIEGKAIHNINNCLPAVLAAYLFRDITIEDIRTGLQTFIPSENLTPGRMNFFHFKNFTVLADFAHNPHGLKLLCDFISKLDHELRIGIISGTGDRRDQDEVANDSAERQHIGGQHIGHERVGVGPGPHRVVAAVLVGIACHGGPDLVARKTVTRDRDQGRRGLRAFGLS
jgi:cyanophycin synthetase